MLIAVVSGDPARLLFYLANYLFMGVGAFAAVIALAGPKRETLELDDYAGLGRRSPWAARDLHRDPHLPGRFPDRRFLAKFFVFSAAVRAGRLGLALVGIAASLDFGRGLPADRPGHVHEGARTGRSKSTRKITPSTSPCSSVFTPSSRLRPLSRQRASLPSRRGRGLVSVGSHGMDDLIQRLRKEHQAVFGVEPAVVAYAPRRVEILGKHTDYNRASSCRRPSTPGSPSVSRRPTRMPAPARRPTSARAFVFRPSTRDGRTGSAGRTTRAASGVPPGTIRVRPRGFKEPSAAISRWRGFPARPPWKSPRAWPFRLSTESSPAKAYLAKIGQRAEHEFAGVRCGLLGQISSLFGREQALEIFTDFRSLEADTVSLPQGTAF